MSDPDTGEDIAAMVINSSEAARAMPIVSTGAIPKTKEDNSPPTAKLAALTRKKNEINELLSEDVIDYDELKTEFDIYMNRLDKLKNATGFHVDWYQRHEPDINTFVQRLNSVLDSRNVYKSQRGVAFNYEQDAHGNTVDLGFGNKSHSIDKEQPNCDLDYPYGDHLNNSTRAKSNDYHSDRNELGNASKLSAESLLKALTQVHLDSRLPSKQLESFDGTDCTKFRSFILNFDRTVGNRCLDDADKFLYLQQYTSGKAKQLVDTCIHFRPEIGYPKARNLLSKQYDNEFVVSNEFITKLNAWPVVRNDDCQALEELSLYLLNCQHYLEGTSVYNQLHNPKQMLNVVEKLPYKLKDRWRRKSHQILQYSGCIYFRHLVDFICEEVSILKQPLFGEITDSRRSINKKQLSTIKVNECLYCKKTNHVITDCKFFTAISYEEKVKFVKYKKLCFACLNSNHFANNCKFKLQCNICKRMHPTVMHNSKVTVKESDISSSKSCYAKTACRVSCPVIPVKIKVKNRDDVITVNCALDNCSTDCWINENLLNSLGLKPAVTKISVSTMQGKNYMKTRVVNNLEVTDLEGRTTVEIPVVYTKEGKHWPFDKNDLVKQEDISGYSF